MSTSTLEVVDLDVDLDADPECQITSTEGVQCAEVAAWLFIGCCRRLLVCDRCKAFRDRKVAEGVPTRCAVHPGARFEVRWVPL